MTKNIVIGVLAVTTLLFGFFAFIKPVVFGAASGTQHYQEEGFQGGLQIGQRGSDIKNANIGKCPLIGVNAAVAPSTTVAYDCAVTGAVRGDTVMGMFATSTGAGQGWEIVAASASTTANFLTFLVTNGTGASAYPPASIASSTQYFDFR